MAESAIGKISRIAEKCLVKDRYVSKEEYEILKEKVLKLQQEMSIDLKK